MEPIRVEVRLTEQDIYEFQKSFLFRRLTLKQCVALYGMYGIFVLLQIITDGVQSPSTMKHLLMLAMPAAVVSILVFFVKKTSKDMIRTGKLFEKPITYELTQEFIGYDSENGSGSYKWSDFYKLKETEHSFLFYISKQQALIMPKWCIKETVMQNGIRALCEKSSLGLDTHKPWKLFAVGVSLLGAALIVVIFIMIMTFM